MIVNVFDNMDAYRGTITERDLTAFTFHDEDDANDTVEVSTTFDLHGGDRLVWSDGDGLCHEHVCQEPRLTHDRDGATSACTALNSFSETTGDFIEDKRPGSSYQDVLGVVLASSRWGVHNQVPGSTATMVFYRVNVNEAVRRVFEKRGGPFRTFVDTDGKGAVATRKIGLPVPGDADNGSPYPRFRLEYGRDTSGIRRTVYWDAITACYGFGRGVETEGGGYGRKLDFSEINGGKMYVADAAALSKYGRPDGNGGIAHVFGVYENPECEDAIELKSQTEIYLERHKVPGVNYEMDAELLSGSYKPRVGDDVQIVDTELVPELRCTGKVSRIDTDMLTGRSMVTVGTARITLADLFMNISRGR